MGYGTRPGVLGHTIRTYWPDDDDITLHIDARGERPTLADLIEKAQQKWPGIEFSAIRIDSGEIQTDCIGYDMYDPADHTDFIILTRLTDS